MARNPKARKAKGAVCSRVQARAAIEAFFAHGKRGALKAASLAHRIKSSTLQDYVTGHKTAATALAAFGNLSKAGRKATMPRHLEVREHVLNWHQLSLC